MQRNDQINEIVQGFPFASDFPSRKHWEAAVWQIIIERLLKLGSVAEVLGALQFLTSPRERRAITYRTLTASRLYTHMRPTDINRELGVARQTIDAIKKSLTEDQYKSAHSRGHKKKNYTPGPVKKL